MNYRSNVNKNTTNNLKWEGKKSFYTKADKGNSIVISDKEDYTQKIQELLVNRQYLKIPKKPQPKCNSFHSVLRNVKGIPDNDKYLVNLDVLTLLRIYNLPKIHRPKLIILIPQLTNQQDCSHKSTTHFRNLKVYQKRAEDQVEKIKNMNLVSFDVEALFLSIPVGKLTKSLENWPNCIEFKSGVEDFIKLSGIGIK